MECRLQCDPGFRDKYARPKQKHQWMHQNWAPTRWQPKYPSIHWKVVLLFLVILLHNSHRSVVVVVVVAVVHSWDCRTRRNWVLVVVVDNLVVVADTLVGEVVGNLEVALVVVDLIFPFDDFGRIEKRGNKEKREEKTCCCSCMMFAGKSNMTQTDRRFSPPETSSSNQFIYQLGTWACRFSVDPAYPLSISMLSMGGRRRLLQKAPDHRYDYILIKQTIGKCGFFWQHAALILLPLPTQIFIIIIIVVVGKYDNVTTVFQYKYPIHLPILSFCLFFFSSKK